MTENAQPTAGQRSRRKTQWVYLLLLSLGVVAVLGILAGKFLLPVLADRYYVEQLLEAGGQPPPAAVRWWARNLRDDAARREKFFRLWRAVRDDDRQFVNLGGVFVRAGLMDRQPPEMQVRYLRLTRLASSSAEDRTEAVGALLHFADQGDGELAAMLRQAAEDESAAVTAAAVRVLPAWADRDWGGQQIVSLLHDERAEVRRLGALAAGLVAGALGDSTVGRSARLAMRDRLVEMSLGDPDVGARANACWGLFRLRWMARSGLMLFHPAEQPPAVRQMAALVLTNMPLPIDHTEPAVLQAVLETLVVRDPDERVRQRAGIALVVLGERGGLGRQPDPAVLKELLFSRQWVAVAIGMRLAGLTQAGGVEMEVTEGARATVLDTLLTWAKEGGRPDAVSEQLAYALGRMATPAWGQAEDEAFLRQRERARAGLAVLYDPSLMAASTQPAGARTRPSLSRTRPDGAAVASPRTRLAVAAAVGRLGEIDGLLALAAQQATAADESAAGAEAMADMACLELAHLARENEKLVEPITQAARRFARDYADRLQRSGALLIGLLGDRTQSDWLLERYRNRRTTGEDKLTTIYMQLALLMLGVEQAEGTGPTAAVNWLDEGDACTPGVLAALVLSGRRQALDRLLAADPPAPIAAIMDDWHLREHLAEWVPELIEPLPAADPDLADFIARMSSWWYQTQRHRLRFDAEQHLWRLTGGESADRP